MRAPSIRCLAMAAALAAAAILVPGVTHADDATSTCIDCHSQLEDELQAPATEFAVDVHNQPGLGCVGCHGGDPTADDPEEAMSPARGFRGTPEQTAIPALCGHCHADPAFMKRFNPNLPTDQLAQYRTSVHGKRSAAGDTRVAVCSSCHGAHGIRRHTDPRSPVYPTHVVDTCAKCHADASLMASYGLPTDQVANYKESVHWKALSQGNDLSAPTCNDCHGSHGATPPGVESVSHVCGTCHPRNMDLFTASPHGPAFAELDAGACEACHGNHRIVEPSDSWLNVTEGDGVCATCHSGDDKGGETAEALYHALHAATLEDTDANLEVKRASEAGMLMEDAQESLQTSHQEIIKARTQVHSVSLPAVKTHTDAAVAAARKALNAAENAFTELRYRRRGLLVALGLILLAIVAVVLKIRQIDAG